jgi:hypothetical protein
VAVGGSALKPGATPAVAQAIGYVASEWAMFEFQIDISIWELANLSHRDGACITSQIPGVARRLYALSSLLDLRKPSAALRKKINSFAEESNKLARTRNRFIHDAWACEEDSDNTFRVEIVAEAKMRIGLVPASYEDAFDLAITIVKHRIKFTPLCREVDGELGTTLSTLSGLQDRYKTLKSDDAQSQVDR